MLLAALSALLAWRLIAADRNAASEERVDYAGMAVLSLAMLALLYALDVGPDWGWGSWPVLALAAVFVILTAAFPSLERRVVDPMVPPSLMRNRQFLLALPTTGLLSPPIFLLFLYFPQYMQKVLGWSPLWASVGMVPVMVALGIVNLTSGHFYSRVGPRRLLATGYALLALGSVAVMLISPHWGYAGLLPAMLLMGIGTGLTIGPSGTATIDAAGEARAGLAGGLAFMSHMGLGTIGVAGSTAIMFAVSLSALRGGLEATGLVVSAADQRTLNALAANSEAACAILDRFGASEAAAIERQITDAFLSGLHQAYWLSLAASIIGIVLALLLDEKKPGGAAGEKAPG